MIHKNLALGNSNEVSVIDLKGIRETTKAMFLSKPGIVHQCPVVDYTLHPEFDEDTLNTIALLTLECDDKDVDWQLVNWPMGYTRMNLHEGQVFVLGYTDQNKVLEQVMHRMEFVNLKECKNFYRKESLDSKWMAPIEYQCFRKKYSGEPCVFDSGMALAVNFRGNWTLIGISVLGPGCTLPTRFIDFAYYVPWIDVSLRNFRRLFPESKITWPNYDKIILEKIDDSSMVMRPYKGTEVIHGKCDKLDGEIMYKEEGKFNTPGHAIGLYGLSVWDDLYYNVSCALLTVECLQRSAEPFSYNFGLVQYDEDLAALTKVIPIVHGDEPVGPKIEHLYDGAWLSWWYRPKHTEKVSNVVFRFEFIKVATLKMVFYGIRHEFNETEPASTTEKVRSRRPHPYHDRYKTNKP
ncbi:uncharacterized protein LOC113503020 [Trichoplusia ni]|uniref:Uncharacterized protein LOC113503020 n=1 Tax=Trichoplusia ni TaxID=7111 RepID=A0A7E5WIK1_TRINI|nr:uncharacterized protein LOC113503020 [Trichoplusia ni]